MNLKSIRAQFAETVLSIAEKDEDLVVLVADISHGIFKDFRGKFPNRYYNIGICEPTIVNMAAGLNKVGINPVVHTIAPFLVERSFEQIKLDFAYQNLNVNLVSVGGSYDYSKLGYSHHCYEDAAILKHFERSQIFFPGNAEEFDTLFRQHYKDSKINYFRITEFPHKQNISLNLNKKIYSYKIKNGSDISIVVLGNQLEKVINAEKYLNSEKINAEIIYYNCLKPFEDKIFLESIKKTKKFLCVEEISQFGGLYEECLRSLSKSKISFNSEQIAIKNIIHDYGTYDDLSESSGVSEKNIIFQSKKLIGI
jgi:transketolase